MAALLGMKEEDFLQRYSERFQGSLRLKGNYEKPCIFLEDSRCVIYKERPSQCRTFPFWDENFRYSGQLDKIKSFCRGIKVAKEVV